jgi:FkbM family methyltransferase
VILQSGPFQFQALIVTKLKDTPAYRKTKRFLKQIAGEEPFTSVQFECEKAVYPGDWCICPVGISQESIVYSFGVGDDVAFDQGLIEKFGLTVFAFDPTPASIDWVNDQLLPGNFHFFPYGLSDRSGTLKLFPRARRNGKASSMFTSVECGYSDNECIEIQAYRLQDTLKMMNHDRVHILKMDIEGAEYGVIEDVLHSGIELYQILVEFHHRFQGFDKKKTLEAIEKLNRNGFEIFYISDLGREYSFIHKESYLRMTGAEN